MKGVVIRQAHLVHEDERRKIVELMNGELSIKNLKILYVKKGEQIMGQHYHTYNEFMYVLRGRAHYWLKNMITGETEEMDVEEGDIMYKTPYIAHTGKFEEDSIIIDGTECETFLRAEKYSFPCAQKSF